MNYGKIVKRKGDDANEETYKKLHLPEGWVQKSQIVAILKAPDAIFCVEVDTMTGNHGFMGVDPYTEKPLSKFAKYVQDVVSDVVSNRLKDIDDTDHESLKGFGEADLIDIIDEAYRVCKRDWNI